MITTGFTLATVTIIGFWLVFRKLPARLRRFLQKRVLFTDISACILTYILFGGTLVALFAAAWMGIFVSILLALMNNEMTSELLERLAKTCKSIKDKAFDWLLQELKELKNKEELKANAN
jgi:hypothetical protein